MTSPRFIARVSRACRTPRRLQSSSTSRPRGPVEAGDRDRHALADRFQRGLGTTRRSSRNPRPRHLSRIVLIRSAGASQKLWNRAVGLVPPIVAASSGFHGCLSLHRNLRRDNSGVNHISNALLSHWASGILCPLFKAPGTNTDRPVFVSKLTSELHVTRREYYVNRAAEFLVASEQIPSDRNALLHMAATYVRIAIESECYTPPGPKASAPIDPNQAPQISI